MTARELRKKYIDFFVSKGHKEIPSASLVPENDPTVLFTTAGMHPLVPFLLGEPHPAGKRLVGVQRCIRTGDIDLVGDDVHLTFFEMLGNWSLGDPDAADGIGAGYWKEDAIKWSWEFLTDKKWLGMDPSRIYVTCFAGDKDASKDKESAEIWKKVGVQKDHIGFLGKDDNWWGPAGKTGPCGPDTEMFYQVNTTEDERPGDAKWPKGKYVEIWNDVFMQYKKTADGKYEPLKQKNVDTGMGVERTLAVLNDIGSVYETETLKPLLDGIKSVPLQSNYYERSARIVADHIRAAVFIAADGIKPSNKDQGYVLRRLIRRSVAGLNRMTASVDRIIPKLIEVVIAAYKESPYDHLSKFPRRTVREIGHEAQKANRIIQNASVLVDKKKEELLTNPKAAGRIAFDLYQSHGLPKEVVFETIKQEVSPSLKEDEFVQLYEEALFAHKEISRKGAAQKFSGGLADHSKTVIRLHTATHLLHQALRDVLGDHVQQKGSNITEKRLRFDFTHLKKLTSEEITKVEDIVNEKIAASLPVERKEMSIEEARKLGAIGLFGEKYGDVVSVYQIGDYSKEFCGGPHVINTSQLGHFHIQKEESSSAGIRRIKAILE